MRVRESQVRNAQIDDVQTNVRINAIQKNDTELWEELYAAAVLETDPSKIHNRISLAQDALHERWHELSQMPLARHRERQRVADAIRTLNLIRLHEIAPPT